MPPEDAVRYSRAWNALEGLSVGDAFGEGFFTDAESVEEMLMTRTVPAPVWLCTDDTQIREGELWTRRNCC